MKDDAVLDHTRLKLPSDDMKFGSISSQLKRLHTGRLHHDLESYDRINTILENAYSVMESERRLAEQAFARELGRPDPFADENFSSREEHIAELAEEYVKRGVSTGPAHTQELIRSIERQAVAQAREHLGPGR